MVTVILVVLIASTLVGGVYFGYQSGYENSRQQFEPELKRQINVNANITKQNEALSIALNNASRLGTVKIGYIAPNPTDEKLSRTLIEDIIQPDLNEYASRLGFNVTFQFVIMDALDQAGVHLQKLQAMKDMGINLVISGGYSSMLSASLSVIKDRDMLLVGTTSTSPFGLSNPNDRLYRMIPPDSAIPYSMASIMWDYGVRSVIILHRGDAYGLGFVNLFKPAWFARGGEFAGETISYPADNTNFTSYLEAANQQAIPAKEKYPEVNQVGILLLSMDEDALIVPEIENYLPLYDCVMFSEFSHIGLKMLDYFIDSPQANHLKVFNPYSHPFIQSIINDVNSRHPTVSGFDDQDTYLYDAAWAIATSVLETRSVDASVVAGVFPDVCGRLYGASGWCKLDQGGDRTPLPLDIYFYTNNHRGYAGLYNPDTDMTSWNMTELIMTPYGR
jgi:branched-chain amino acid transport system substrate-binding protein